MALEDPRGILAALKPFDVPRSHLKSRVVHLIHTQGWSQRKTAAKLGVARGTVSRLLTEWSAARELSPAPRAKSRTPRARKIQAWNSRIQDLLATYKDPPITAQRVFEILKERGFCGGYTVVKQAVRERRPKQVQVKERFETAPGEQGQVDWVNPQVRFLDGESHRLKGFVLTLGYSRRAFLRFARKEDFLSLVRCHRAAFEYFGGVPRTHLYDGMKTVVTRWEAGVPLFNPRFLLFATHYGFLPKACRPYRPETKGKVERVNRYIRGNFLVGRTFADLDDLNEQALTWCREVADTRIHGTTRERPINRFDEERAHLLPLPARPYDTCEVAYRMVALDGFVDFQGNRYSVPPAQVARPVIVKASERALFILSAECEPLTRHQLAPAGVHVTRQLPEHRVRGERRGGEEHDRLRRRFLELGEDAAEFLVGLGRSHPRTTKAHIRSVLALLQSYSADDVERALAHGLRFGAFDAKVVEDYLTRQAEPRSLEGVIARSGSEGRGGPTGEEVIQRDGAFYDELLDEYGRDGGDDE